MRRTLGAIGRAFLLLLVWGCAAVAAGQAIIQTLEHQRLAARVNKLESEYNQQVGAYADTLAAGDKIAGDQDFRMHLLKDRFGYSEPDESPIVIIWDTNQDEPPT